MTPAPTYAKGTTVPVEKTKAELDGLLGKHGAATRGIMHDEERDLAAVMFVLQGRKYRIELPMPARLSASRYEPDTMGKRWQDRPRLWLNWSDAQRQDWVVQQHAQAVRERWRGLLLMVKAKLQIVAMGISSFEREFLADLVLPNGHTAHDTIGPYMRKLIEEGYTAPLALPEAT
jgi:hypothetical protein